RLAGYCFTALALRRLHAEEIGGPFPIENKPDLRIVGLHFHREDTRPAWIDQGHVEPGIFAGNQGQDFAQDNAVNVGDDLLLRGLALPADLAAERTDVQLVVARVLADRDDDAIAR